MGYSPVQFSSIAQLFLTLCDLMDCSTSVSSDLAHVNISSIYLSMFLMYVHTLELAKNWKTKVYACDDQ